MTVGLRSRRTSSGRTRIGRLTVATRAAYRVHQMLGGLEAAGYAVRMVGDADELRSEVSQGADAILIDITDADQRAVLSLARSVASSRTSLILVTASSDLSSGIAGLEAGADDLLTTTMSVQEHVARVRAVLRRRPDASPPTELLTGGPVRIDAERRRVEVRDKAVFLTSLELKLLSYFLMNPEQPVTREGLLEAVWGYTVGATATVTVHVRRLREKIEEDPAHPMLIRTVWGIGYCFSPAGP